MQIVVHTDSKQELPPITMFLAKKGLPFTEEEVQRFRRYKWGYECRLLSRPDKIIAYYYIPTSSPNSL
ncbi:MAG: hypothetical protein ACUVTB_07095 [Candidatus Bathycorpusculaceae bacterium]